MMVQETAGAGESWLVNALFHLLGRRTRRVVLTEMTAILIGGSTLHSLLQLPLWAGRALQGDSLKKLQHSLNGVNFLVIEEVSMVSQSQYIWVDGRLRQAIERTNEVFGRISVLMSGKPGQPQPVFGRALHGGQPKDQVSRDRFYAYRVQRHLSRE